MTVDLAEAQARLREILDGLTPGDAVVLVDDGRPVGTLVRSQAEAFACRPGSARDSDHWMAPDFNAPLEDFREYAE